MSNHKRFFTAKYFSAAMAVLSISPAFAVAVCAAPNFTLEAGVRLATASVYCVTPVPGGYRMYYSSATREYSAAGVMSSSSTDGLVWAAEPGVRLSTGVNTPDASSITAMGLYFNPALAAGPYKAYYVGLSSHGLYSILSATSTDGLAWGKVASFSIQFSSGLRYIASPSPYGMGGGNVMLYYVRDSVGAGNPADYRAYRMSSTDDGETFSAEVPLLSGTVAYNIAVSTLTSGSVRMFITAPLPGGTTGAQVLTAISPTGSSFSLESGAVFSTSPVTSVLSGLGVVRATDTFRWRAYMTLRLEAAATSYVYSGLTLSPTVTGFSPATVYINDPATDFAVTGEVFSSTKPTVSISKGADILAGPIVTRNSDMSLTVRAVPTNAALGTYSVTITNPDGNLVTLADALKIDYRSGYVAATDNLFRPLAAAGNACTLNVTTFLGGNITIKAYTVRGGFIKTIQNGPQGAGTFPYVWRGDTTNGSTVASGLYLLHVKGPKIDVTEKVVVIK